jgi:D-glycero-beta-D-manno-heptose 1-phosphate adenylyltransferase
MSTNIEILNQLILNDEKLDRMLAFWRFKGKKIVFSNGCFDILHQGHVDYLSKSADLGDVLVIGVNTDASVHRLKGETRPINDEYSRALLLASLRFVGAVVLFDEDTPYELIKKIQPDILVKGNDYKPETIVGYDIVTAKGGSVVTIPLVEGYSTSSIERKIVELNRK